MSTSMILIEGTVLPEMQMPSARIVASPEFGVLGSVVRLDGRTSQDPDGLQLTYSWSFVSVPIGSRVGQEGFRVLDTDSELVSFSPDVVGEYVLGLVVSNGMFSSSQALTPVSIRALLVPHGRGIIPDGKFIWSYIRDIWTQVEGKEWFETLWSALIQLVGTEMLKLYQNDFNKSIRDIQDLYQRRWLSYEPKLALSVPDLTFFLGNHQVGADAGTGSIGVSGLGVIFSPNELIIYSGNVTPNVSGEEVTIQTSLGADNIGSFTIESLNSGRTGYKLVGTPLDPDPDSIAEDVQILFTFQSKNWTLLGGSSTDLALIMSQWGSPMDYLLPIFSSPGGAAVGDVRVGDIIHFPTGPNAGFYRIVEKSGSFLVMDRSPSSFSDEAISGANKADIYRPVSVTIEQPDEALSDTISLEFSTALGDISSIAAGRVVVIGDQTFTILRSVIDTNQRIPIVVITTSEAVIPSGMLSQFWRIPHTLVSTSQDFDALGVSAGDLVLVDVIREDLQTTAEVVAQVVGVDGYRLGFVLTDEDVSPDSIPSIPNKTLLNLSTSFGLSQISENADDSLSFSGTAQDMFGYINSGKFQSLYWNKELSPETIFNVGKLSFKLRPKAIYRNRRIPVDETLMSVPVLQQFIRQPSIVERDKKIYQLHNGQGYELAVKPAILTENLDFIIDSEVAFNDELTFLTGTDIIEVDDGDFVDRGVKQGDVFEVVEPVTLRGSYLIHSVLDKNRLKLSRSVPLYVLGDIVTAKVKIVRDSIGHFLRFTPDLFTAKNHAPDRLWGEVSFFDNRQTIEDNFGILVALKRADLEDISTNINYRQAVAGLMFAFTKGSSIDRTRLGAQILLGLPFAEHRGVIRSIEDNFRLNSAGEPVLGRLLVEDIDNVGSPLGTQRVYTFPIDEASALAGIETNPETEKTYVVGDIVEIFQPLAKGVVIDDYLNRPLDSSFSAKTFLQQYHSIRVRINDNIFGLEELDLVSSFLKKITPSYIAYSIVQTSEYADSIEIADRTSYGYLSGLSALVDNASFSLPGAIMFDSMNFDGYSQMLWDGSFYWVRRFGRDLSTVDASYTISIPSGGLEDARENERFESPLVEENDYLIVFDGENQGRYLITEVVSDTQLTLEGDDLPFEDGSELSYAIVRKITGKILEDGSATVVNGNETVVLTDADLSPPHLRTRGIADGDWLILYNASTATRHIIKSTKESAIDSEIWDRVNVTPIPDFSGTYQAKIIRPSIFDWSTVFNLNFSGAPTPATAEDQVLKALLDPLDELETLDPPGTLPAALSTWSNLVIDPIRLVITPGPAHPPDDREVRIKKRGDPEGTIGFGHLERFAPHDSIDVAILREDTSAYCQSGNKFVDFSSLFTSDGTDPATEGARPGDFLVLTSGGNSTVNVGFGLGVYVIENVQVENGVWVTTPLTVTGSASWKLVRRR